MPSNCRALGFALVLALVGGGCSHATGATTSSTSTSSTVPATPASVYASLGNFTVGVVTLHLPAGNAVEVWYPANGSVGVGSETYDARAFLPTAVARRLGPKVHAYVGTDANRNVIVGAAGERFPLVVFSHGDAGYRDQSTFLTTRLASWGMVVAAPDDPSRDLADVLAPSAPRGPTGANLVRATIDLLQRENAQAGGPFNGRIDFSKVAVVGLDTGGTAAIAAAAADSRVDAYVALASDNQLATQFATPGAPPAPVTTNLPAKPSLFVAGADDHVVPPAAVGAVFRAARAPSYEWVIDGAGHNAFDDFCIVAKAQGAQIGLGDPSGIGAVFPASLRTIVTDGCAPPALDVTKTWAVIDQVVTAFLRHVIGSDPVAVGVGPPGPRTIDGVRVTVSARPG